MSALPIPLVALEDCGAILGRRGAGKSATKQVLLEHELDAGHRCVLIDPKGDSWGIRLNPDKTPSRFGLPIFGGAHGDVALVDAMGSALGRMVAEHDLSCVIDLSAFSTAGMRRFMRDFAEALFEHNRAPLTLFVDEADQLAPQTVPGEMAMLLHHMERLIRQGRQRGIFMWMLTQRPQTLNKNLLSQAETLIAMKMTTPHDRKAIAEWMEAHDPVKAKEVLAHLAELKVGEAYAWVPTADFLERVRFPLFSTYDSGRTPQHGEVIEGVTLPPIDLGAVTVALAGIDEEVVVDNKTAAASSADVEKLRDEVRKLEAGYAFRGEEIDRLQSVIAAHQRAFEAQCSLLADISWPSFPRKDGSMPSDPLVILSLVEAAAPAASKGAAVPIQLSAAPDPIDCPVDDPGCLGGDAPRSDDSSAVTSAEANGGGVVAKPSPRIDWVIVGGESGSGARPMHPGWARSLRDQCAAAGVAFFMKQTSGERKPLPPIPDDLRIMEWPDASR